jgi:hypothetical protein
MMKNSSRLLVWLISNKVKSVLSGNLIWRYIFRESYTIHITFLFSELETSVENLRSHVINKKTRVSMADVEQLATLLSRSRWIETLRLSAHVVLMSAKKYAWTRLINFFSCISVNPSTNWRLNFQSWKSPSKVRLLYNWTNKPKTISKCPPIKRITNQCWVK